MGEAREVMDQLTDAVMSGDLDQVMSMYAPDAVLVAPDAGEIKGRDRIAGYFKVYVDALTDLRWEPIAAHEAGSVAVDEGYFAGTHTGDLQDPSGEVVPATGRPVRVRECDVATVANGVITRHHFYFDQMEFLEQLGLLPDMAT